MASTTGNGQNRRLTEIYDDKVYQAATKQTANQKQKRRREAVRPEFPLVSRPSSAAHVGKHAFPTWDSLAIKVSDIESCAKFSVMSQQNEIQQMVIYLIC